MTGYISESLSTFVADRAGHTCEYCLIHEEDTYFGCEIDHIISLKHGGSSEPDNLAFSRAFCNRYKGSDSSSINPFTQKLVRLFNPRIDKWTRHFRIRGSLIEPLTEIGEVTARVLGFNRSERVVEREALIEAGNHPPAAATLHRSS